MKPNVGVADGVEKDIVGKVLAESGSLLRVSDWVVPNAKEVEVEEFVEAPEVNVEVDVAGWVEKDVAVKVADMVLKRDLLTSFVFSSISVDKT